MKKIRASIFEIRAPISLMGAVMKRIRAPISLIRLGISFMGARASLVHAPVSLIRAPICEMRVRIPLMRTVIKQMRTRMSFMATRIIEMRARMSLMSALMHEDARIKRRTLAPHLVHNASMRAVRGRIPLLGHRFSHIRTTMCVMRVRSKARNVAHARYRDRGWQSDDLRDRFTSPLRAR